MCTVLRLLGRSTAWVVFGLSGCLAQTPCPAQLTPARIYLDANSGTAALAVDAAQGCAWSVSTPPPWLVLKPASEGKGPAELRLQAAANRTAVMRRARLTVNGAAVTVVQRAWPAQSPDSLPAHGRFDALQRAALMGLIRACGEGLLCPESAVTRAEAAEAVALGITRMKREFEFPQEPVFPDVPADHPAFAFIQLLGATGVAEGCSGGQFCPDYPISKADLANWIYRARTRDARKLYYRPVALPKDVPAEHPAAEAVRASLSLEYLEACGVDEFCPEVGISRADFSAAVLYAFFPLLVQAASDDRSTTPLRVVFRDDMAVEYQGPDGRAAPARRAALTYRGGSTAWVDFDTLNRPNRLRSAEGSEMTLQYSADGSVRLTLNVPNQGTIGPVTIRPGPPPAGATGKDAAPGRSAAEIYASAMVRTDVCGARTTLPNPLTVAIQSAPDSAPDQLELLTAPAFETGTGSYVYTVAAAPVPEEPAAKGAGAGRSALLDALFFAYLAESIKQNAPGVDQSQLLAAILFGGCSSDTLLQKYPQLAEECWLFGKFLAHIASFFAPPYYPPELPATTSGQFLRYGDSIYQARADIGAYSTDTVFQPQQYPYQSLSGLSFSGTQPPSAGLVFPFTSWGGSLYTGPAQSFTPPGMMGGPLPDLNLVYPGFTLFKPVPAPQAVTLKATGTVKPLNNPCNESFGNYSYSTSMFTPGNIAGSAFATTAGFNTSQLFLRTQCGAGPLLLAGKNATRQTSSTSTPDYQTNYTFYADMLPDALKEKLTTQTTSSFRMSDGRLLNSISVLTHSSEYNVVSGVVNQELKVVDTRWWKAACPAGGDTKIEITYLGQGQTTLQVQKESQPLK
ncbi:MAG: BACON domain-containing protein [Acidobacteria bacterium]|nr:BACON domain-containing protein [Acidobacteriota bacterium]